MDPDGARRLNRSSPSCLNSGAQRTDFFHGLLGYRHRRCMSSTQSGATETGVNVSVERTDYAQAASGRSWRALRPDSRRRRRPAGRSHRQGDPRRPRTGRPRHLRPVQGRPCRDAHRDREPRNQPANRSCGLNICNPLRRPRRASRRTGHGRQRAVVRLGSGRADLQDAGRHGRQRTALPPRRDPARGRRPGAPVKLRRRRRAVPAGVRSAAHPLRAPVRPAAGNPTRRWSTRCRTRSPALRTPRIPSSSTA